MKYIYFVLILFFNFKLYGNDVIINVNAISSNTDTLHKSTINLSLETRANIYALRFDLNFNDNEIAIDENNILFFNEFSKFYIYENEENIYEIIVMSEYGNSLIDAGDDALNSHMIITFSPLKGFNDRAIVEISNFQIFGFSGIELSHNLIHEYFHELSFEEEKRTKLYPNNPNPFKNATTITYQIADTVMVLLSVYDSLGDPIDTLVNGLNYPDKYNIMWHALDYDGKPLPSGKYIISLETQNYNDMIKMTLLR